MRVRVRLDGNLRAILDGRPEELVYEGEGPLTVREALARVGVPPMTVVVVLVDGQPRGKDSVLESDSELVLFGPLAGG